MKTQSAIRRHCSRQCSVYENQFIYFTWNKLTEKHKH